MENCNILNQINDQEEKKKKFKEKLDKAKECVKNTIEWGNENKEFLMIVVPVIVLGIKKLDKHADISREKRLKECSIYDHSMGMYLESKKPLTTAQKLDIDAMHKQGMSYAEIGKKLRIKWK